LIFPTSYTIPTQQAGGGERKEGTEGEEGMQRTPSMPDLDMLNDTFVDLLSSMGISSDYQHMFMKLPANKKWVLISQHKNSIQVHKARRVSRGGRGGIVDLLSPMALISKSTKCIKEVDERGKGFH
jgi:hypothetical protein